MNQSKPGVAYPGSTGLSGLFGKGQFFPISGEFIDSTIKVTDDSTGIVEKNAIVKSKRKPKSK